MKIIATIILIVCATTLSGCVALLAGAAGGAGTALWISNKLGQDVNRPADQVVKAAKEGLAELKLPITKETHEPPVTQLRAEYKGDQPVWVDVRSISASSCRLEVRVGFGNKEATREVFDAIVKHL